MLARLAGETTADAVLHDALVFLAWFYRSARLRSHSFSGVLGVLPIGEDSCVDRPLIYLPFNTGCELVTTL